MSPLSNASRGSGIQPDQLFAIPAVGVADLQLLLVTLLGLDVWPAPHRLSLFFAFDSQGGDKIRDGDTTSSVSHERFRVLLNVADSGGDAIARFNDSVKRVTAATASLDTWENTQHQENGC